MGITRERIGDLRHRITFQTLSLESDGQGGQSETWDDAFTAWARVRPMNARERLWAEKNDVVVTHEITLRYRTDVTSEMRFIYDGRTFQVKAPFIPDERKAYLVFQAEEGVGT